MALRIGTSGFDYKHWQERFYPRELPSNERLAFYARRFDTVELNVTFYRMPAADAFRRWAKIADEADRTAEGPAEGVAETAAAASASADGLRREPFVFAVKASRYLTHVRRLLHPADPVAFLMDRARLLGRHLGPILLQLPPDMEIELERLDQTLAAFESDVRVAVEPRHDSWFVPELEALLRARGAALCLVDRHGLKTPLWQTTDWTYVRFHAGGSLPPGCYRDDELATWARRLTDAGATSGFAYFNNDGFGCAIKNGETLRKMLEPAETPAER